MKLRTVCCAALLLPTAGAAFAADVTPRKFAEQHAAAGNEQLVLSSYARALAADPADVLTYQSRGFYYLSRGKTELALEDFSHQIALRPDDPAGYLNRGLLFGGIGRERDAAADFAAACRLGSADGCVLGGTESAAPGRPPR